MDIWEKIESELQRLSVKTDSLSKNLLSDNETLIPHLLLNLEIDVIKQVLKSSVGLALFDDYKGANVVEKNGSYLIIECGDECLASASVKRSFIIVLASMALLDFFCTLSNVSLGSIKPILLFNFAFIGELRILNASKLDKGLVLNARHSSPHSIIK
jgi:hypothetical protein